MKTDTTQELRTRILDEAAKQFDKKGIKFKVGCKKYGLSDRKSKQTSS